jgi:lipocalin
LLRITDGKAKLGKRPGQLRVSFFLFFYSDYNILALGENYDWALVGSKSPKYLWILSRTPRLPAPTIEHILSIARARGYDTSKLIWVRQ